jgi:prophage antirepressor-like protein
VLQVFDVEGSGMRFGVAEDGRPYVVAEDFTPSLNYSRARDALRMVDKDEKGAQIVRTPGGPQQMAVLYEDGIWELIFLSRKPEAKAIKKRVKAILRQIRETGRYEAPALGADLLAELEQSNQRLGQAIAIAKTERAGRLKAEVERDAYAVDAHSWQVLGSGEGDFSVSDAAKILSRDPAISIGRDRLFTLMAELRWTYRQRADGRWRAYQAQVDNGRLSELPQQYEHPTTGEIALAAPQVRVVAKGLQTLHRHLGGIDPLYLDGAE